MDTRTRPVPTRRAGWRAMGTLWFVGAVLIAFNGLYVLLVAFGNITDYSANEPFVQHVLAMDTTNFGAPAGTGLDPAVMWRAVTDPGLVTAAYVGVILWEAATAVVLGIGLVQWVRGRGSARSRVVPTIGLLMIVALFFGGFIVIGGEWFQMWRSTAWNGLDPAFRNAVLAVLALVVLHLPGSVRSEPEACRPSGQELT
jgi:predicted small integral membrane protein